MASKKWTYEICRKVAINFTSLRDFRENCPKECHASYINGWMKDFTWLSTERHENGYWTYDRCLEEAKKYSTKADFMEGSTEAYKKSLKEKWFKDYTWLKNRKRKTKWSYELCYNLALECRSKSEMKEKDSTAYLTALKNDWVKDYTWFLTYKELRNLSPSPHLIWTYEKCKECALSCKTLAEFRNLYPGAIAISYKKDWLKDFDWLSKDEIDIDSKKDNVYSYVFEDLNSIYIGRSINPKSRDYDHRRKSDSTVYKFSKKNNIPIPEMIILESNLTLIKGLEREDYYRNKFEQEGWNVINIAKTGIKSGSLGRLGRKWSREACEKEAKKYENLKDFRENSSGAYNVSTKRGWIKDYVWLKTKTHKAGYWNYDKCLEEAKKYETRRQFKKESPSAYANALKNKWIDDYSWLPPKNKGLDYEACYKEAKKYTKLSDFSKNSSNAYKRSLKKKWIKDFYWLKRVEKNISKRKVILQYSLDGSLVGKFLGAKEAANKVGGKAKKIYLCCRDNTRHYMGFYWRYEKPTDDEQNKNQDLDNNI